MLVLRRFCGVDKFGRLLPSVTTDAVEVKNGKVLVITRKNQPF